MIDTLTETEQRILLQDKAYGFHILRAQGVKKIEWSHSLNRKYQWWKIKEQLWYVAFGGMILLIIWSFL